jgi:hypothetical protein
VRVEPLQQVRGHLRDGVVVVLAGPLPGVDQRRAVDGAEVAVGEGVAALGALRGVRVLGQVSGGGGVEALPLDDVVGRGGVRCGI